MPVNRCYAGNGPTLVFTEILSQAAAATLDLNLAVVLLHEEYKPFITVTNAQGENIISDDDFIPRYTGHAIAYPWWD